MCMCSELKTDEWLLVESTCRPAPGGCTHRGLPHALVPLDKQGRWPGCTLWGTCRARAVLVMAWMLQACTCSMQAGLLKQGQNLPCLQHRAEQQVCTAQCTGLVACCHQTHGMLSQWCFACAYQGLKFSCSAKGKRVPMCCSDLVTVTLCAKCPKGCHCHMMQKGLTCPS